ncbi:unnamed protein product [Sphagnum jensenii]|uniref:CRAL-TRIO domain-containing protein n=1 Tax=Sphagnum jensenii TaxID=128206 RepID=A0ABP1B897_9BRYO
MATAERKPIILPSPSGKIEPESSMSDKIAQVLQLVQKEGPLSKKQAAFCDDACVERYLKVRGNNCRRAARLLKATLNWREKINIGYLIADEFPTEIAAGAAYVAGFDDEGRPVLIIKKKPDHIVNHNQKPYLWYIIFTMEVAVAAMPPGVDQCVLILDAGGYSRISAPSPGGILATLRIIADHYPERVAKAFIVDASSMFYYAWKGICTFVDHSTRGRLSFAYLKDYIPVKPQQALKATPPSSPLAHFPKQAYFPDDIRLPSSVYNSTSGRLLNSYYMTGLSRTSCFSLLIFSTLYTKINLSNLKARLKILVNNLFDWMCPGGIPLSPRYNTDSPEIVEKAFGDGPELTSRNVHRSFSFSFSSAPDPTHHSPDLQEGRLANARKDKWSVSNSETPISAPARCRRQKKPPPSPDGLLSTPYSRKKPEGLSEENKNKSVDIFQPYVRFLTEMYDEAAYRALMKPPLGGLMSIVSRDHLKYQMNSDSSLT